MTVKYPEVMYKKGANISREMPFEKNYVLKLYCQITNVKRSQDDSEMFLIPIIQFSVYSKTDVWKFVSNIPEPVSFIFTASNIGT